VSVVLIEIVSGYDTDTGIVVTLSPRWISTNQSHAVLPVCIRTVQVPSLNSHSAIQTKVSSRSNAMSSSGAVASVGL